MSQAERSRRYRQRLRSGAVHAPSDVPLEVLGEMIDRGYLSEGDALDNRKVGVALVKALSHLLKKTSEFMQIPPRRSG